MIEWKYVTDSREPFFDVVLDYVTSKSKILDVGSGDGAFARRINRYDVYLLEGSQESAKRLKEEFLHVSCSRVPKLPYEDSSFDLIHSSHLVEHLQPQELYDFLKEIDRCLKPNGYVVISAPMLWTEFYDDLSHVKPYYPKLFYKYLCWGEKWANCCTRPIISDRYEQVKEIFRYHITSDCPFVHTKSSVINGIIRIWNNFKKKLGFYKLEKSGYTIVLKKHQ